MGADREQASEPVKVRSDIADTANHASWQSYQPQRLRLCVPDFLYAFRAGSAPRVCANFASGLRDMGLLDKLFGSSPNRVDEFPWFNAVERPLPTRLCGVFRGRKTWHELATKSSPTASDSSQVNHWISIGTTLTSILIFPVETAPSRPSYQISTGAIRSRISAMWPGHGQPTWAPLRQGVRLSNQRLPKRLLGRGAAWRQRQVDPYRPR